MPYVQPNIPFEFPTWGEAGNKWAEVLANPTTEVGGTLPYTLNWGALLEALSSTVGAADPFGASMIGGVFSRTPKAIRNLSLAELEKNVKFFKPFMEEQGRTWTGKEFPGMPEVLSEWESKYGPTYREWVRKKDKIFKATKEAAKPIESEVETIYQALKKKKPSWLNALKEERGSISNKPLTAAERIYTPEYRKTVLEGLATTPERKKLLEITLPELERAIEYTPRGTKGYLFGSYPSFKPIPKDVDVLFEFPTTRSWNELGEGIKGEKGLHIQTSPPIERLQVNPIENFKKMGQFKYGPDYDLIRILSAAGLIPASQLLGGEPQSQPIEQRQQGGPVNAGSPYVVGEQGPEVVVPNQLGYVYPSMEQLGIISRMNERVTPPLGGSPTKSIFLRPLYEAFQSKSSTGGNKYSDLEQSNISRVISAIEKIPEGDLKEILRFKLYSNPEELAKEVFGSSGRTGFEKNPGAYSPSWSAIYLAAKPKAPADLLGVFLHELGHHETEQKLKQMKGKEGGRKICRDLSYLDRENIAEALGYRRALKLGKDIPAEEYGIVSRNLLAPYGRIPMSVEKAKLRASLIDNILEYYANEKKGPQQRQFGGPVNAGQPYLVGEQGPEVVVPKQSGQIIPNVKSIVNTLLSFLSSERRRAPSGIAETQEQKIARMEEYMRSDKIAFNQLEALSKRPDAINLSPELKDKMLRRGFDVKFKDWKEKQYVESGVYKDPDKYIWVDHPMYSDWYSKDMITKFSIAAKKYGVDPYDYIALGIVESGLGRQHPSNPSRVLEQLHGERIQKLYPEFPNYLTRAMAGESKIQILADKSRDILIDYGARYLSEQLKKYPDKESGIQAYSGTGKTVYGGDVSFIRDVYGTTRMFGKPFQQIDFWKEKPQAKRILDTSKKLKENSDIVSFIEGQPIEQRQQGGPVKSGSPYIVGEQGPEVMVPNRSGTVVPNSDVREPYPSELLYFKQNPQVSGMYTEDRKIILNPYSGLSDQEKAAVVKLERYRLFMDDNNIKPTFDLTLEQMNKFRGTAYEKNSDALKLSIISRILVGDPSAGNVTPEQKAFAEQIRQLRKNPRTILQPQEEKEFSQWYQGHAKRTGTNPNPNDPEHYYDLRGAWKSGIRPTEGEHLPDTYKLPGHPKFSIESNYYKPGMKAGRWEGDRYIPLSSEEAVQWKSQEQWQNQDLSNL